MTTLTKSAAVRRAILALNASIKMSRVELNIAHKLGNQDEARRYRTKMQLDKEAIRILQSLL
jgi:hypothetical protein